MGKRPTQSVGQIQIDRSPRYGHRGLPKQALHHEIVVRSVGGEVDTETRRWTPILSFVFFVGAWLFQVANLGVIVGLGNPFGPILKTSTRHWYRLYSGLVYSGSVGGCVGIAFRKIENLLGRMILPAGIKANLGAGVWNMSMDCAH